MAPPEDTGLEAAHYLKQQNLATPLVFTLESGEVVRGTVEWYDRDCLKIRRADGPALVIMKQAIVHSSRDEDEPAPRQQRERSERP